MDLSLVIVVASIGVASAAQQLGSITYYGNGDG